MTQPSKIVELKHVEKVFTLDQNTQVKALVDIDLSIYEGDYCCIIGPSGSGKSTLLYIMGCLDTATRGTVIFRGKDVAKLSDTELTRIRRSEIGFVFQSYNLIPTLSTLENVLLPCYREAKNKECMKQVVKILEELGLKERVNHLPSQLSGGEQQRVAVARALINEPSLILMDEPTGCIDAATTKKMTEIFDNLSQKGHTIVIVTHDPTVSRHAKEVFRLESGKLVEEE